MGAKQFYNMTTVESNPGVNLDLIIGESISSLATNTTETIAIYSPAGTISRVRNIYLQWDALTEPTAGNRSMSVNLIGTDNAYTGMANAQADYSSTVSFVEGEVQGATSQNPADKTSLTLMLRSLVFDDTIGLGLYFLNTSNAATVARRQWRIFVERQVVT